jgi:hypothetical protein
MQEFVYNAARHASPQAGVFCQASYSQETHTTMPLTDNLPPAVRRPVEQLSEAGTPVVTAVREAAARAAETARTLAYAYVGALDLAQERLLKVTGLAR